MIQLTAETLRLLGVEEDSTGAFILRFNETGLYEYCVLWEPGSCGNHTSDGKWAINLHFRHNGDTTTGSHRIQTIEELMVACFHDGVRAGEKRYQSQFRELLGLSPNEHF